LIVFHALFRPKEGIIKLKKRKEVKTMNLIEKVYNEMSTDADGNEKQAQIAKYEYMHATIDQQKAIDRVFIALCGWSLRTLIKGHKATESYNPYK
jgi:hypothetical protein